MALTRSSKWFNWLWRLTVLCLPWQTRWFTQLANTFGSPDRPTIGIEQLRLSIYGSQFLLLITVIIGLMMVGRTVRVSSKEKMLSILAILGFSCLGYFSFSPTLTLYWWAQTILLGLFVFVLWRQSIPAKDLAKWMLLSLLPALCFGIWQTVAQMVPALKWFGIAAQNPSTPGVSVIGDQRWLRLYGIFPHPNIFAGWIVIIWLIQLVTWVKEQRNHSKWQTIGWGITNLLCGIILFLTYSRTAWLAMIFGLLIMAWNYRQDLWFFLRSVYRQRLIQILSFASLCLASALLVWQWPQLRTRGSLVNRLEQVSLNERQQSMQQGWQIAQWPYSWAVGVGPGNYVKALELYHLEDVGNPTAVSFQPVPPHFIWLIVFIEFGIPGCILLFLVIRWLITKRIKSGTVDARRAILPILGAFFILSCGDHYLWTLWPGKTLVALGFAWIILSLDSSSPSDASYQQPV